MNMVLTYKHKNGIFQKPDHNRDNHIPFSETWINPYPVFEKPEYAGRSTPKEAGLLLHVYVLSQFLIAADYLSRPGFSQVTETQTMVVVEASHFCSYEETEFCFR